MMYYWLHLPLAEKHDIRLYFDDSAMLGNFTIVASVIIMV